MYLLFYCCNGLQKLKKKSLLPPPPPPPKVITPLVPAPAPTKQSPTSSTTQPKKVQAEITITGVTPVVVSLHGSRITITGDTFIPGVEVFVDGTKFHYC